MIPNLGQKEKGPVFLRFRMVMTATRTLIFLGTGTSVGVPMVGCECAVCQSADPRNQRFRCSVLIQLPQGNLLIDTSPELRLQLLRERIRVVHAVLYTHYHADHIFGLDDLRPIPKYLGGPVPLFCSQEVERKIRQAFAYAFTAERAPGLAGYLPSLTLHRITEQPFEVLGQRIVPIPLRHAGLEVFGFRLDNLAYCTDVSSIPEESWPLLEGLDILVLDALRYKPHPAHFSLSEALEVIARLRPAQAYLTHIAHDLDHETVSRQLPPGVALAYDGLRIVF
jgi:phosphoribosyl 1,2-cyclic phosphate phosphodiesterase